MAVAMARRPNLENMRLLNDEELTQLRENLAHLSESAVKDFYNHAHRDCAIIVAAFSDGHLHPATGHGMEAVEEVAETVTIPWFSQAAFLGRADHFGGQDRGDRLLC